jgi:glycosyltransferase involved in cell wall biosynthesis
MKAFDHLDEVWVPSKFVYDAVAPASTKPVAIFPHAVPSIEPPATYDRNYFGLRPDAFVILVAFDLNSHLTRKNPQGAIEAVRRAFGSAAKPNVQLVIKLHGLGFSNARKKVHKALGGFPEAVIIDRVLSREEMWGLQACCDVYLSLHRSEGFGLNIAECMALGKCVIATNYSGNTDYFDKTCGAPVGYSLIRVGKSDYIFPENQYWAEPDIDEAARLLRRAAEDAAWRASLGRAARIRIVTTLSYEAVGKRIVERLSALDADFETLSLARRA